MAVGNQLKILEWRKLVLNACRRESPFNRKTAHICLCHDEEDMKEYDDGEFRKFCMI